MPVAINYDRILEDNVLIAAGLRGDRRFGARITVVVSYIFRKLWQAVRGQYSRFGSAAVVFGEPISLRDFGLERSVEDLADTLMGRIAEVMPVLFVPLLAHTLREAEGSMSQAALLQRVREKARQLGPLFLGGPEASYADATKLALTKMVRNGLLSQSSEGVAINPGQEHKIAFYANSIAHHFEYDAIAAS
jgi:glycerol-3-phosphate O-acyltransferase